MQKDFPVQFIKTPGGEELVVLPRTMWDQIVADAHQEAADILEAHRVVAGLAAGTEETVPLAVVQALTDGQNPVKVWREHRGMTQDDLATAINTNRVYLSQIENNRRPAGPKILEKLAKALRVDVDDLEGTKTEW